jgi:hypothetical protein
VVVSALIAISIFAAVAEAASYLVRRKGISEATTPQQVAVPTPVAAKRSSRLVETAQIAWAVVRDRVSGLHADRTAPVSVAEASVSDSEHAAAMAQTMPQTQTTRVEGRGRSRVSAIARRAPVRQSTSPTGRGSVDQPAAVPSSQVGSDEPLSSQSVAVAEPAAPPTSSEIDARPSTRDGRTNPPAQPTVTYGVEDLDVTPPRRISPGLLNVSSPSSGGRGDELVISVVVNETGSVESVSGVRAPRNIGESQLLMSALSTVKSWHFRPATRNGLAVRYRQLLAVPIQH